MLKIIEDADGLRSSDFAGETSEHVNSDFGEVDEGNAEGDGYDGIRNEDFGSKSN